ncbi:MAG: hypothetical protein MJB14_17420, partial [Spirochaetes bacterium]|nr:hypothetical protein [Spirochaetota bacterium]
EILKNIDELVEDEIIYSQHTKLFKLKINLAKKMYEKGEISKAKKMVQASVHFVKLFMFFQLIPQEEGEKLISQLKDIF